MIEEPVYGVYKPKSAIHAERKISREKLIAFVTSMRVSPSHPDNDLRYLYQLGRNVAADVLLASIYCGDLDEPKE